jgi:hypothetical protein
MTQCRISKLQIQGFRAFGTNVQTLEFPSQLAALWGTNSQGKTSLAEAVEFLLTGQIIRRTLLASSQDEFADALRNAHLANGTEVFVQATIVAKDGLPRTIRRTLKIDYGKKQDCETVLEVDGKVAREADLLSIGIVLSQPPFSAPVLAQHTLGYLFSARPQDRASYFKAILEVTDLDEFRSSVASLEKDFTAPPLPLVDRLGKAAAVPGAAAHLKSILTSVPDKSDLETALAGAIKTLIEGNGEAAPEDLTGRIEKLETILADRRARTFPLKGFDCTTLPAWLPPAAEQHTKLDTYIAERLKVEEETRRLTGLFREALALPAIAKADAPLDCPLCGVDDSLTLERIAFIRQRISDTEAFQAAEKGARETLNRMTAVLDGLEKSISLALPAFITSPSKSRRTRDFRMAKIRALLGDDCKTAIAEWVVSLRLSTKTRTKAVAAIRALRGLTEGYVKELETLTDPAPIKSTFTELTRRIQNFQEAIVSYGAHAKVVSAGLTAVVDAESATTGWDELIALAKDPTALRSQIIEQSAYAALLKELAQAVRQIDKGNELVIDEKFSYLSGAVETWWNLLRPDELSFFSAVKPRPGARRTIDFKAGLSAAQDRSDPKLRDVIAVFSQSQLHCLGLALFLARATQEGTGFIVLDDPILSSDEDYRAHFNSAVIEELCKLGIQVIVLTQDQGTVRDLCERYEHLNISRFHIALENPAIGSTVTNTADDIETKLARATTLIKGADPALRKQGGALIRDAAERLCKELLVKDRRAKGQGIASINDYANKTLGELVPLVQPLLANDASHPGKLRAIGGAVNPAQHDAPVPASGVLKVALGDLRFLKKNYLP